MAGKEESDEFMHDNISPFICKEELNHRYKAQQKHTEWRREKLEQT